MFQTKQMRRKPLSSVYGNKGDECHDTGQHFMYTARRVFAVIKMHRRD